jgi:hypothetical protein
LRASKYLSVFDAYLLGKEEQSMLNGIEFVPDEDRSPVHIAYGPTGFNAISDAIPRDHQINGYDIADKMLDNGMSGYVSIDESVFRI